MKEEKMAMNARERFHEIMEFNTDVRTLKYEYAYWGGALNRWYAEGLPKKYFVQLQEDITTPTSSLYLMAFQQNQKLLDAGTIPDGMAVWGGGVYWPTQGLPKDRDVEEFFGLDHGIRNVDINQLFDPMYEVHILEESDDRLVYTDIDGIERTFMKHESTLPTPHKWPIDSMKAWQKVKEERLQLKDIEKRLPKNWEALVKEYDARDYPLTLGGYPHGFFGLPAHLMGYENLFLAYYDMPEMIHDMLDTFTEIWLALWEIVTSRVEIDMIQIFEDVSMGTGPMISETIFREFMMPYYKRVAEFAKAKGIKHIFVDTDGDCNQLIPLFLESGVNGLYPMEVSAGMDILRARKEYPELKMFGGISKYAVANGGKELDDMLETVETLLKEGGYVPFIDHSVPDLVSFKHFSEYRTRLNQIIDESGVK